jgi:hypothetical protein
MEKSALPSRYWPPTGNITNKFLGAARSGESAIYTNPLLSGGAPIAEYVNFFKLLTIASV